MMLDYALQYAGRGWRVFPCHTTISGQCSCGKNCGKDQSKHPRIKAWQKAATTNRQQIERWWTRWPDANIGIATGNGLIVLDLDGPEEAQRFAGIAVEHSGLPPCPTVRTGRGLHLYLQGDVGGSRKVDGLLIRGAGGFVIAPPSWHASGKRYEWIKQVPLPQAPQWFLNWATRGKGSATRLELPPHLQGLQVIDIAGRIARSLQTPWTAGEDHRIREALAFISADCERDTWLHIGMALHALDWERSDGSNRGYEIWLDWSQTAKTKFESEWDLETRWKSFGKAGREQVTLGTLYHYAQQAGWMPERKEVMPPEQHRRHDRQTETQQRKEVMSLAAQDGAASPGLFATPPHSDPPPGGAHVNGHAPTLPPALVSANSGSPLIELNKKYCVIGDVGGKCMVMGMVPSKVDSGVEVPSFQSFKSFAERFGNRYVETPKLKNGQWVNEAQQLGGAWLKWTTRRSYEGLDMVPGAAEILPNGYLNLWRGFSVKPRAGQWSLLKQHIAEVLGNREPDSIEYIIRWAAWKLQHPGERPEVALVFKGRKGAGKGTFARILRQIFGPHGLQIFNSKHLVGSFNGHLRNCLLLYADEAFWAGDKQGESTLKGLITEPTIPIEQKGIDVVDWRNRIGLVMTTNAEWVVPASHDERRYAIFQVGEGVAQNDSYFKALWQELESGGIEAMLHDLLALDLKGWHPRRIPQTEALQQQKLRSLDPRYEWFESLLSEGVLVGVQPDKTIPVGWLYEQARAATPRLRDVSVTTFARFLSELGCIKIHNVKGNTWQIPELAEARERWERRFGPWHWEYKGEAWRVR